MNIVDAFFLGLIIFLIFSTVIVVVYSDMRWDEWYETMDSLPCYNLLVELKEKDYNNTQEHEIMKMLHEKECYEK